jgi:hypothetical protein
VIAGEDIACDGVCGLGIAFLCFLLWVVAAFLAEFVLKKCGGCLWGQFFPSRKLWLTKKKEKKEKRTYQW